MAGKCGWKRTKSKGSDENHVAHLCVRMKLYAIQLVAITVTLLVFGADGAESDFYERFTSLIQTNRFGPALTNSTLSLARIRKSGEIAGVKLGTGMSAAVERWGKPRTFYASCGGGPLLAFGHGSLGFRGDKLVRIAISPNDIPGLSFESGLTATNSPTQFARVLGLSPPDPTQWYFTVESETGVLALRWTHMDEGVWRLDSLSIEAPRLDDVNDRR
jgi:hypothetical protein